MVLTLLTKNWLCTVLVTKCQYSAKSVLSCVQAGAIPRVDLVLRHTRKLAFAWNFIDHKKHSRVTESGPKIKHPFRPPPKNIHRNKGGTRVCDDGPRWPRHVLTRLNYGAWNASVTGAFTTTQKVCFSRFPLDHIPEASRCCRPRSWQCQSKRLFHCRSPPSLTVYGRYTSLQYQISFTTVTPAIAHTFHNRSTRLWRPTA